MTPRLLIGLATTANTIELSFNQQGVAVETRFNFDITTNQLHYQVRVDRRNPAELYAVTLIIDEAEGFELNDPIVLNLIGPESTQSSGDYFMSPQFRQAFAQQRVFLKIFASPFSSSGATQLLQ